jgi:hypothetical protein
MRTRINITGPKPDASTHGGVVYNHAYSILAVHEAKLPSAKSKQAKLLKLLQIRNPWGHGTAI